MERRGKLYTQETREIVGTTVPKGPPEVRIKALKEQGKAFKKVRMLPTEFRKWARENLGVLTAIAISIAGIITTVVVAGKKTIMGASSGLGAAGKALGKLAKSALPILVPFLNLLSIILSWGAKGLSFLAKNLWIVAILITGAIYKYLQSRREKVYDNSGESLLEVYKDLWLHRKQRDDMVEDGIASEATRKKISKDDDANDDVDATSLFEVFGTKQRI
ncbi:Hypothetical predicted protein [Paramuricea clavata]|uniref:Uncharacterized protein n=1 Tax=Paramuricea clavata TaxID=317549 RepID=A0A6S7I4E0_PARCT|nr:Hypothetical predicted protein [Paramuricea clavata]